jgi:hypothetical protein
MRSGGGGRTGSTRTGASVIPSSSQALVWREGSRITLSNSGVSTVNRINDAGVVVGSIGSVAYLFVPQTTAQALPKIIDSIQALVSTGALAAHRANPLQSQLGNVAARLADGNAAAAVNLLQAFINKVNALAASGQLAQADAEQLMATATNLIERLQFLAP